MKLSNKLKRRFVNDMMLPVHVFEEPHFSRHMEAIDKHYGSMEKLGLLIDMLVDLGDDAENKMFALSSKLQNDIVSAIQATPAYCEWRDEKISPYKYQNSGIPRASIYTPSNVDKRLVSIDLAEANFASLWLQSKDIVLGFDSYAEMVGSFTKYEYFKRSKHIRQMIFGSLCPSRQQTLWRVTMDKIVTVLRSEAVGIETAQLLMLSNDEVIFEVCHDEEATKLVERISVALESTNETSSISRRVKIDVFDLRDIKGSDKKFYVKEHIHPRVGKVEFKTVPSYFFMQAFKRYVGLPIEVGDLIFYHDGVPAFFAQPIYKSDAVMSDTGSQ